MEDLCDEKAASASGKEGISEGLVASENAT
jgi:hypothetical protein